ncbi:MAG: transcriptional repressor [Verrucomicrobiaceae bacterium]|nr:transcriptional repressor [Verrucomicrobiaceae bacterium]
MSTSHQHPHTKTTRDPECVLCQALDRARAQGLRMTRALEDVLRLLIDSDVPLTLADIAESRHLSSQADRATVYRLLTKLEKLAIIRRLGLHDRAAYYTMIFPGEHNDYLVCTECGKIARLDIECPVEELETRIEKKSRYTQIYHELMFFGVCPKCGRA